MAEEKEQHPDTWDKTHELYKQLEAEKLSNIDPCSLKGYWTGVKTTWWAYVGGVGRGFWACVEMVASPIQTVKGLFNAAVHWDQTIQILWAQIKEASKTSEGIAGGIGNMMGGSLFFGVFGKLFSIARAGLVSKLGRVSNKVDDAAQLGKIINKADGALTKADDVAKLGENAVEGTAKRTQQTAKAADDLVPSSEATYGVRTLGAAEAPRYIRGYGWTDSAYWRDVRRLQAGESIQAKNLETAAALRRDAFPNLKRTHYRGSLGRNKLEATKVDLKGTYDWHNPSVMESHTGPHQIPHLQIKTFDGQVIRIEVL